MKQTLLTLTIVLVALKLTGVLPLAWIWVLAPAWLPLVVGLVVIVASLLTIGVCGAIKHLR